MGGLGVGIGFIGLWDSELWGLRFWASAFGSCGPRLFADLWKLSRGEDLSLGKETAHDNSVDALSLAPVLLATS